MTNINTVKIILTTALNTMLSKQSVCSTIQELDTHNLGSIEIRLPVKTVSDTIFVKFMQPMIKYKIDQTKIESMPGEQIARCWLRRTAPVRTQLSLFRTWSCSELWYLPRIFSGRVLWTCSLYRHVREYAGLISEQLYTCPMF